jgi:hypothetical protein
VADSCAYCIRVFVFMDREEVIRMVVGYWLASCEGF